MSNNSATFDRFGFRIDEGESLEDKAEKLRRQAVDHHDQLDEGVCQVRIIAKFEIRKFNFFLQLFSIAYFSSMKTVNENGKRPFIH